MLCAFCATYVRHIHTTQSLYRVRWPSCKIPIYSHDMISQISGSTFALYHQPQERTAWRERAPGIAFNVITEQIISHHSSLLYCTGIWRGKTYSARTCMQTCFPPCPPIFMNRILHVARVRQSVNQSVSQSACATQVRFKYGLPAAVRRIKWNFIVNICCQQRPHSRLRVFLFVATVYLVQILLYRFIIIGICTFLLFATIIVVYCTVHKSLRVRHSTQVPQGPSFYSTQVP